MIYTEYYNIVHDVEGTGVHPSCPTQVRVSIHHSQLCDNLLVVRRGIPRLGVLGAPAIHVSANDLLVLLCKLPGLFDALGKINRVAVFLIDGLQIVSLFPRCDKELLPLFYVSVMRIRR